MVQGRTCRRRFAIVIAAAAFAAALAGCGDDEATQRKAFIAFLQTRIVAKPGIHVPHLTADETAAFGPYAKDYAIIADFNGHLDQAVSVPMRRAIESGAPHSLGDAMARRQDIAAVRAGMAQIRAALDRELATADAAHAALKQPDDLRPVYDAAYERDVTQPAHVWIDIFPVVDATMKSMVALADFVGKHRNGVEIQGSMIQLRDPGLQAPLQGLLDTVRANADGLAKAQDRLNALASGD